MTLDLQRLDGPIFIMREAEEDQLTLEEVHDALQRFDNIAIHREELEGRNPQTGEPIVISSSEKVFAVLLDGQWEKTFHFLEGIFEGDFGYRGEVAEGGSAAIEILFPMDETLAAAKQLAIALEADIVTHDGTIVFEGVQA